MSPNNSFFRGKFFITLVVIVVVAIAFAAGAAYGINAKPAHLSFRGTGIEARTPENVDFELFWKAWTTLNEKFVATHGTSTPQDRVYGAIMGMTSALKDPYTVFMPPQDAKDFETQISGNFEGVGMEIDSKDGIITVVAPLKDSPAYKAGVKSGDKIIKIGDLTTAGMRSDEAVKAIRGPKGSTVRLLVLREGVKDPFEIKIVRDVINFPTLETELKDGGVFVIRLYNFSAISANLFEKAIITFQRYQSEKKANKLVLDLRGNPGGYLDAAIEMASWFLPKGTAIVREDYGPKQPEEVKRSYGYNTFGPDFKMVILVDGGSASASEILAGALSENGVAKLVGTKTFGKGSVQELVKLTSDTNLKVTIARWLTPKGHSISEKGIAPDVEVKFTPEDAEAKKDPQLDKALELLKK